MIFCEIVDGRHDNQPIINILREDAGIDDTSILKLVLMNYAEEMLLRIYEGRPVTPCAVVVFLNSCI